MALNLTDKFLTVCKSLYIEGITPNGLVTRSHPKFQEITKLAKSLFVTAEIEKIKEFFKEDKYLIELWTAHLLIEYGNPSNDVLKECISIIKKYAESKLDDNIAEEELRWLNENRDLVRFSQAK